MPEFAYTARNASGQRITGVITAGTEREAIHQLSSEALFPLEVKAGKSQATTDFEKRKVSPRKVAMCYAQMASLLRSGVPLLKTLKILSQQSSGATLKQTLSEVHDQVEEGQTLAEAFARYPRVFSSIAVNMVRAGGEGGFMEDALQRVATFTEQQEDLKSRTMGALIYPVILAVVGTAIVTALVVFVVPRFSEMFARLEAQNGLPLATYILLGISKFMSSYGLYLLAILIAGVLGLRMHLKSDKGQEMWDAMKLRIPFFGGVLESLAVARFCRVLGTLLKNGVPILKSLEISRDAAGNRVLSAAIAEAAENISSGESLAQPLLESKRFPQTVCEMIHVAEESNTLDTVLVEIADGLEQRTGRRLDMGVRLLEPIMLVLIACVVLFVAIALLLPVIKMGETL